MRAPLGRSSAKAKYKSSDLESWISRALQELIKEQAPSIDEIRERYKEIFEWAEEKKSFQELLWELTKKEDLLKEAIKTLVLRKKLEVQQ